MSIWLLRIARILVSRERFLLPKFRIQLDLIRDSAGLVKGKVGLMWKWSKCQINGINCIHCNIFSLSCVWKELSQVNRSGTDACLLSQALKSKKGKRQPNHWVWGKHRDKLWETQVSQDMMIPTSMKLVIRLPDWRTAHSLSELQSSATELKWICSSFHYTEAKIIDIDHLLREHQQ